MKEEFVKGSSDLKPRIENNLDTNFLKIVAVFAMIFDHIGKIIFPNILWLQIVGRISFPLFAYCIVVGSLYTSNIKSYALRLLMFGIISQPFYVLVFKKSWISLNIFATLLVGLLIIWALKEKKWIVFGGLSLASFFLNFSYGIYGILLMIIFYLFRNDVFSSAFFSGSLLGLYYFPGFFNKPINLNIQEFAVFSLPLIYLKTNFKFKMNKYFFYSFYPAHLLLLFLLKKLI